MTKDSRDEYRLVKDELLKITDESLLFIDLMYDEAESHNRKKTLTARQESIKKNEFTIVVIGEIKHGKSTLLNSMLHKPAFPKDICEATATVSFLRHNDNAERPEWKNKAVVFFHDANKQPIIVDHLDLKKYTTCIDKSINVAEEIKEVSVYTDSPFVQDGVTVVDTPGTNTTIAKHDQITHMQVDKSNAAIFLFKAGMAGKASDYEFLSEVSSRINKFFFVINRIDEAGGMKVADELITDVKRKMKSVLQSESLDGMNFYPTSGLLALLSRFGYIENEKFTKDEWDRKLNENPRFCDDLLNISGVPALEKALLDFLFRGERNKEFIESHLKFLESIFSEAKQCIQDRQTVLDGNMTLQELDVKKQLLDAEIEKQKHKLEGASDELAEKLSANLQRFLADFSLDINNSKDEFDDLLSTIGDYSNMRNSFSQLQAELNKKINHHWNNVAYNLRDLVQDTFRAADRKLKGQLNKSLEDAGIFKLPDAPDFTISFETSKDYSAESQEVKQCEQKINELEEEILNNNAVDDYDDAKEELKRLEENKKDMQHKHILKSQLLGQRPPVEVIVSRAAHSEYEWRGGLLGTLKTLLVGRKKYDYPEEKIIDDSARKSFDKAMQKLEEWEQNETKKIEEQINESKDKFSEAKANHAKTIRYEKIKAAAEQKRRELKQQLAEKLCNAETDALIKNKTMLKRTLSDSLDYLKNELTKNISGCRNWAADYINNIQIGLSDFMIDKKKEVDNLTNLLKTEENNKQDALGKLVKLSEKQTVLNEMLNALKNSVDQVFAGGKK